MENKLTLGRQRRGYGARALTGLLGLAVIVLMGLIFYTLLNPVTLPRNAVEKDLIDSKAAVERYPKNYDARIALGAAYAQIGDHTGGIEQFKEAIKIDSSRAKAYFNIGFTYKEMGRFKEAVTQLKKASKHNVNWTQPYFILAKVYGEQGDYDRALAETDKIIKLSPDASDILYLQGTFYEAKKDKAAAIEKYKEALKYDRDPDSPHVKALIRLVGLKDDSK